MKKKKKYRFTLINFDGELIDHRYYWLESARNATIRGAKLFWDNCDCARLVIEVDYGILITIGIN